MHNTLISELESLQPSALDAGLVFSGKASGRLIQGYAKPSAYTPAIDPNYLFHESSRDIIVWLMNPADPLYVFGPTGCGKTSCIKQLAARLSYPVFEVTGHGRLEFADLTGHLAVKDGNMVYEYGPLALAMLHELAQRIFPQNWPQAEDLTANYAVSATEDSRTWEQCLSPLVGADLTKYSLLPSMLLTKTSNNPSGGKFWRAGVLRDGLHLNWGRFNTTGQHMTIQKAHCVHEDPVQELINRGKTKIRSGYTLHPTNLTLPKENA